METITVNCDDVVVQGADGTLIYPRRGCHIVLTTLPSVGEQLLALRLTKLALSPRTTEVSLATVDQLEGLINDLCDSVKRRLVSWDWKDGNGEPLSSPPTRETLLSLTIEELTQLATMRPLLNPKGLSISTARSPGGRKSRRRKPGI